VAFYFGGVSPSEIEHSKLVPRAPFPLKFGRARKAMEEKKSNANKQAKK